MCKHQLILVLVFLFLGFTCVCSADLVEDLHVADLNAVKPDADRLASATALGTEQFVGKLSDHALIELVRVASADVNAGVKAAARATLVKSGKSAEAFELAAQLKLSEGFLNAAAAPAARLADITALSTRKVSSALIMGTVVQALADADLSVRKVAVSIFSKVDARPYVAELATAMVSEADPGLRAQLIGILAPMGKDAAFAVAFLNQLAASDPDPAVKVLAKNTAASIVAAVTDAVKTPTADPGVKTGVPVAGTITAEMRGLLDQLSNPFKGAGKRKDAGANAKSASEKLAAMGILALQPALTVDELYGKNFLNHADHYFIRYWTVSLLLNAKVVAAVPALQQRLAVEEDGQVISILKDAIAKLK